MNSKSRRDTRCVFCGRNDLTKEHVFPNWMSKLFLPNTITTTSIDRNGVVEKNYTSPIFKQTLKRVCKSCNNGWMSTLEADTKRIIEPMLFNLQYTINLNQTDQSILAFWAQKTCMILSLATGSDYKLPKEHFINLFTEKKALDYISVRIGWRIPKANENGHHLAFYTLSEITGPIPDKLHIPQGSEVWRSIITIGNIVFHLSGASGGLRVEIDNNDYRVTPQIYPFVEELEWPMEWPVDALTSVGASEFGRV